MECRTGLCGRTGLTSGADEFVFTDLDVHGVPVLRGGDHGNGVSFLLRIPHMLIFDGRSEK